VAGGANLLNLFDLRPGRAIKVAVLSAALIAAGGSRTGSGASVAAPPAAAGPALLPPLAAALALLPEDLGERAMLGDCGANALGAMLGAAAAGLPRAARIALLAGITGLTAASEKVSFTKVIERTPALRRLDMLGRRGGTGGRAAPPCAGGFPRGVRGDGSPRERTVAPPGPTQFAATTLRSAENTVPPPPEE